MYDSPPSNITGPNPGTEQLPSPNLPGEALQTQDRPQYEGKLMFIPKHVLRCLISGVIRDFRDSDHSGYITDSYVLIS
jgi:hypothetical protein